MSTNHSETSLAPLIFEAERVLAEAIQHFGLTIKPEQIVVTIQNAGRKQALGWFGPGFWKNGQPAAIHEINLSAEYLKTHDMGETLIHELAHAENEALGIRDCSGRRHNKKFKTMAERLGLTVLPQDKAVGWGFTDHGAGSRAFLEKIAFKRELFDKCRLQSGPKAKAGSRLVKCECPACGYTVRTTRKWLDVGVPTCPCGTPMEADAAGEEGAED